MMICDNLICHNSYIILLCIMHNPLAFQFYLSNVGYLPGPGKSIIYSFLFRRKGRNCEGSTGCPKSHCAKVRAYCSACDHLIRKISSGMFQKSSSFEEFNGLSEIDVHFFSMNVHFTRFLPS